MKVNEILRLVWINLIQNKFKVILTSIGIVVGAATIMMVIDTSFSLATFTNSCNWRASFSGYGRRQLGELWYGSSLGP